ncbi:hypothetical protein LHM76_002735 [Listeria monocytogenes]|nr:hypothetical protein [Listeria monocytogenes]EKA2552350.1 hypothetical protein [Listeria monocytogenes]EKA2555470.1 hypothetical protein [Listeria monocytogenes]EKA2558628.1 hypothetical protein [Listeria monocytogenes]EKA2561751.1 hypothetical protein [Listeria monocytogenes]
MKEKMENGKKESCLFYLYYKNGEHVRLKPDNTNPLVVDFLDNLPNQVTNDSLIISAIPTHIEFLFWTKIEAQKEALPLQVAAFFFSFYEYAQKNDWGEVYERFYLTISRMAWQTAHVREYYYK